MQCFFRKNVYLCRHNNQNNENMEDNHYLHCYKMVWDTEFAPNPHHGVLTLATCKPRIRKYAKVGDWISGWTAIKVHDKDNRIINFPKDDERLIYLAKVTEKLTFEKYWYKYKNKRPHLLKDGKPQPRKGNKSCGAGKSDGTQYNSGDNIYEPLKRFGKFKQHPNGGGHGEKDVAHDLSGEYVLICEDFYYFGVHQACIIDSNISPRPIPRWKKVGIADAQPLISFIQNNFKPGIVTNDESNLK